MDRRHRSDAGRSGPRRPADRPGHRRAAAARRHVMEPARMASTSFGAFAFPPPQQELLASPLDYLFAESCRILRFCDALDMAATDPDRIGRLAAPALIDFLRTELPRHFDDME